MSTTNGTQTDAQIDLATLLTHATGSQNFYQWSALFPHFVITEGVRTLAEHAGAYWLADAIASHIVAGRGLRKKMQTDARLRRWQFWRLKVNQETNAATLTCRADSRERPACRQKIEYTDFPLASIDLWASFDGQRWTILLPSEY